MSFAFSQHNRQSDMREVIFVQTRGENNSAEAGKFSTAQRGGNPPHAPQQIAPWLFWNQTQLHNVYRERLSDI